MSNRIKYITICLIIFIGISFLLGSTDGNKHGKGYQSIDKDSTIYIAILDYIRSTGLHFKRPQDFKRLKIDPHIVDSSYNCCDYLEKDNIISLSSGKSTQNRRILKKLKIPETNILRDQECIFSGGLPEPPEPNSPNNENSTYPSRCEEQGFFLSVIFSQPESTKDANCKSEKKEMISCWKVYAFEYSSYSRFIYTLYLIKDPLDGWKIIRKERLFGMFS